MSDETQPHDEADAGEEGELASEPLEGETETRRFERTLPHPPEKVWRALTEEGELEKWFPAKVDGDLEEGAKLHFRFDSEPDAEGEVTRCDPPHVLTYTMGRETLRWELSPIPEGTLLVFTTETKATSSEPANDNGLAVYCMAA
jgi:uncharacterized protein YndB with AHSA1/START domain